MTTGSGNPEAERKARCAGWPQGSYSANGDTKETIAYVRLIQRVGRKKRCWK